MAEERFPEFRMCPCGAHGRIVLADGHAEPEVYSQKLARLSIAGALEQGRLEMRHCLALQRAVRDSGLAPNNDDADAGVCRRVWDWNNGWERRRSGTAEPPCLKEEGP